MITFRRWHESLLIDRLCLLDSTVYASALQFFAHNIDTSHPTLPFHYVFAPNVSVDP